jgi:hypothetical protein
MRYDLPVAFKEFEIVTTVDKDQRDRLFEDLRRNGNELEKQVVKFSGVEPVLGEAGTQEGRFVFYDKKRRKPQWRPHYRSTWSVAYPQS